MESIEVSAKTLNDAITEACVKLGVTSDNLKYEIIEEGSAGFLGIGAKPYVIKAYDAMEEEVSASVSVETTEEAPVAAAVNSSDVCSEAKNFLTNVFRAMNMVVVVDAKYNSEENTMDIDLSGEEMGVLIGKRGQTLDSLQYLVSLVVNKNSDNYIRVKVDTENYRERRKDTLENLARNIAYKVKRTRKNVSLEPMNPYERRIIHSALQNDKYVTTFSEGEEPFRRVVVTLRK